MPSSRCLCRWARRVGSLQAHSRNVVVSRSIQISSTPTVDSPAIAADAISASVGASSSSSDARFDVLGTPYSMLSVSLSASQNLYTRRGTLVGLSGRVQNVQSTLSIQGPIRRSLLGIPFLYQRVTSTTPISALISTRSPITSIAVLHLDGTSDWIVSQRKGLLAWTGHTLSATPTVKKGMSWAQWGNTIVTGRGLVALAGSGQIYQITLKAGEQYIAYPGNVLAYTVTQSDPLPYRLKSSSLRFQIPTLNLRKLYSDVKFLKMLRESALWRGLKTTMFHVRTATRRTIWGDSLFLQFEGPMTILLSSRATRMADVLSNREIDETADSPPSTTRSAKSNPTSTQQNNLEKASTATIRSGSAGSDVRTGAA